MLTSRTFEDRRGLQSRLTVLRVAAVVCFSALAVAFWLLQVVQHAKYEAWADKNYLRTIPLRAPRGVFFDRNGRVLVENREAFTIALLRERTANLDQAITRLSHAIGVDEAEIRDIVQRHRRDPIFRPITIVEHATLAQVAAVKARQLELPEVVVQQVPTRSYRDDVLAAHLFGYVSEIHDTQVGRPEFAGLEAGAIVGQAGLERVYNALLMGTDGRRNVVVNSVGREIERLGQDDPVEGSRMQLTIDYDLQRALEEAFAAAGYAGAAAFMDPRTGEILAMTSQPAYNPNDFAVGIDSGTWADLNRDPLRPLSDRLIQGRYAPGSTFKIVMAIAALSEGVITPDFKVYCSGSKTFYGRSFGCSRPGGHGLVDLRHALEQSCNVYFYTVGDMMKIDTIYAYAKKLGLVGKTGIDLPGENESVVPSTEWKQREFHEPWYPGETISVSIGQGALAVTPIALGTMIATVANGGTLVTPHLVRAVENEGGGWKAVPTPAPRDAVAIPPAQLQAVRDGLWLAVNGAGTAGRARIEGKDVSGKTGTAQVISAQGARAAAGKIDTRDNAWFVFFAPRDNPEIAGVVFAEHEGHGGTASAPIAKYVMETYFAKKEGRPLPALPAILKAAAPSAPGARGTAGDGARDPRDDRR